MERIRVKPGDTINYSMWTRVEKKPVSLRSTGEVIEAMPMVSTTVVTLNGIRYEIDPPEKTQGKVIKGKCIATGKEVEIDFGPVATDFDTEGL